MNPFKPKPEAKVILDSIAPSGRRLTTFEVKFHRFVLSELNTHRVFSRNSASSRAIPVAKTLERVNADPAFPLFWGKNQKGMQAQESLDPDLTGCCQEEWAQLLGDTLKVVHELNKIGLHKQTANRLLEPFMWHTAIITATSFENFFALRNHPEAQPEMQALAKAMADAYRSHQPTLLPSGQWHTPYLDDRADLLAQGHSESDLLKISVGRCARVSYLTHDGVRAPQEDIRLHNALIASGHMSPTEHVAMSLDKAEWNAWANEMFQAYLEKDTPMGNVFGWKQYRKTLPHEDNFGALRSPEEKT